MSSALDNLPLGLTPAAAVVLALSLAAFVASLILIRQPSTLYYPSAKGSHPSSAIHTPPPQPLSGPKITNSIVVPAYHEHDNLRPLVEQVFAALREKDTTEMVIVDDNSRDGTVELVEELKKEGYKVELLVRTAKGEKGLSSAVLRGFEKARGDKWVVMDADLQHPPSLIQPMFDAIESPSVPIAMATRYGEGVSMSKDWPVHRRIISWGARILARPLTSVSDPMTGCFAIRKETFLKTAPINTAGFKLALEILIKAPSSTPPPSVAYSFGTRAAGAERVGDRGESKLGSKVILHYVGQLLTLYSWAWGIGFNVLIAAGVAVAVEVVRQGTQVL